jgi:GntR family transcriptional regulator, transcriptional repressor for pyruvate dehydrogenase complex
MIEGAVVGDAYDADSWFTWLTRCIRRLGIFVASRPQLPQVDLNSFTEGVRSPKTAELVANALRRMIVEGQLLDGDFLPNETDLMAHFDVSRPTLREAVRVLESERLVEVRRGSRLGARVRIPGPEIVARPAALLLELSGATLADVMEARIGIEPTAARLLAANASPDAIAELRKLIDGLPAEWESEALASAAANFHRRIIELSGAPTLGIVAGMLHEITERHIRASIRAGNPDHAVPKPLYNKLRRSFSRLLTLVAAGDEVEAERHWRRHMEYSATSLLAGMEKARVRDIMH